VKTRIIGIGGMLLFAVAALSGCAGQAGAAEELAVNDVITAEIVDADVSVEDAEIEVFETQSKLDVAIAGVEHSIEMMGQIVVARLTEIDRNEIPSQNDERIRIRLNASREFKDLLVNTIIDAQADLYQLLEPGLSEEERIIALQNLQEDLKSVYEPNGPYENLNNFPAHWLANLPNGDPRNLPFNSTAGIGPESLGFERLGLTTNNFVIGMGAMQTQCFGDRFVSMLETGEEDYLREGHCGVWKIDAQVGLNIEDAFASTGGIGVEHASQSPSRDALFDGPENAFISPQMADIFNLGFGNGFTLCQQVNTIANDPISSNGFGFERDINGFLVVRLQDWCADEWLTDSVLPNGGMNQAWGAVRFGPESSAFDRHQTSNVVSNIESCDALGMSVRPGGCWDYAETETIDEDWFAALAPYGRDWVCEFTMVDRQRLNIASGIAGLEPTMFQHHFVVIGRTPAEVELTLTRFGSAPGTQNETSDALCRNSSGIELTVSKPDYIHFYNLGFVNSQPDLRPQSHRINDYTFTYVYDFTAKLVELGLLP